MPDWVVEFDARCNLKQARPEYIVQEENERTGKERERCAVPPIGSSTSLNRKAQFLTNSFQA